MAQQTGYVTDEELAYRVKSNRKEMLPAINQAIAAASSAVDDYCHRHFRQVDPTPEYVQPRARGKLIRIPDAMQVAEVAFSSNGRNGTFTAYESDAYFLRHREPNWPAHIIECDLVTRFPCGPRAWIRVTPVGYWGWDEVPPAVREATLIQAHKLYRREASPEGLLGFELGGGGRVDRNGLDGDARQLLRRFVHPAKLRP